MDCREFRNRHVGYVDDTLPIVEMEAMRRHLRACSRCSHHDTTVRRSLLVVRNLPSIEPSPDFMARLNARIGELGPELRTDRIYQPSIGAFAALAAGVALVSYMAFGIAERFTRDSIVRMPPVVASLPERPRLPVNDPVFMASMTAGIPVWQTMLTMEQAPLHMVNLELQQASLTR
jgi:anti-sigma factor RsiW